MNIAFHEGMSVCASCVCSCMGRVFGELCPSTVLLPGIEESAVFPQCPSALTPPSLLHNKILWPLQPLKVMQRIGAQGLCLSQIGSYFSVEQ